MTADPVKSNDEAIRLLTEVVNAPGSAAADKERAKAALFELQSLAVGRPAPEIEGQDVDGKPMKLSDFRGKVVLLDFWGHW